MGSNKLFPFMMRDGLSDLNDGTIDGVYYCSSGNETNAPITERRLIVNVTSFNGRISQMAISEKGESYSRFCINQVWSAWQRLDNFGYNSLAELSAGILSTQRKWLNSGDDLNNVIETGIYRAGGATVENNPTAATYFMLIVESFDESSILQKFIHNDGRVWFRSRYGSEWREWKQIV